ncbi:unnamed protein product [Cuscuta europaea]|uniref:Uncharacterized protein n=1 Tax=Cuscuta europaea TaxID=41803 RepID=A0A9P1E870_CUSEU|nr:unnamed protein product [Cuscuta europaea]
MRGNKWLVTEDPLSGSGSSKQGKQEGIISAKDEVFGSEGQRGVSNVVDTGTKEAKENEIVAMEGPSGEQKRRRMWEAKEHEGDERVNMALDFSKNEEGRVSDTRIRGFLLAVCGCN